MTAALPAVGDTAAVASHSQTFLQVRCKARGGDASAAVGTHTLLVFPLVVHLAEHIHSWLVHNFWKWNGDCDCSLQERLVCFDIFLTLQFTDFQAGNDCNPGEFFLWLPSRGEKRER